MSKNKKNAVYDGDGDYVNGFVRSARYITPVEKLARERVKNSFSALRVNCFGIVETNELGVGSENSANIIKLDFYLTKLDTLCTIIDTKKGYDGYDILLCKNAVNYYKKPLLVIDMYTIKMRYYDVGCDKDDVGYVSFNKDEFDGATFSNKISESDKVYNFNNLFEAAYRHACEAVMKLEQGEEESIDNSMTLDSIFYSYKKYWEHLIQDNGDRILKDKLFGDFCDAHAADAEYWYRRFMDRK